MILTNVKCQPAEVFSILFCSSLELTSCLVRQHCPDLPEDWLSSIDNNTRVVNLSVLMATQCLNLTARELLWTIEWTFNSLRSVMYTTDYLSEWVMCFSLRFWSPVIFFCSLSSVHADWFVRRELPVQFLGETIVEIAVL